MADEKKTSVFIDNMAVLTSPEGIQKYIFGSKKNGQPRAVYDIVKDFSKPKKKKKKKKGKKGKGKNGSAYAMYVTCKKKKGKKHWHI